MPRHSAARRRPYSIWRKLQRKSIGFDQLSDIYAFRVIVGSEDDCYHALGVVHRAWPCVPDRFKDFISHPKRNNYRSLHTTVVGPRGMRIEMQIRTEAMDRVAEEGVAAHWRYKNQTYGFDPDDQAAAGGSRPPDNLRELVQVLEHGGDAEDLVEHAKLEMFLDQVFVFTPKGRLISLPRGAMPLDFAYAVHTDVGRHRASGSKINGELRPLRTRAAERRRGGGDPRRDADRRPRTGRSLTVTGRARSAIRRHIRLTEREEFHSARARVGRADLPQGAASPLAVSRFGRRSTASPSPSEDELFQTVGRGRDLARPGPRGGLSRPCRSRQGRGHGRAYGSRTAGRAGPFPRRRPDPRACLCAFAPCCRPVPGDRIVGIAQPDGAPDGPHRRLRPARPVRGARGTLARPAVDGGGRAQQPGRRRGCTPRSGTPRACSAKPAPSSARPAATSSA